MNRFIALLTFFTFFALSANAQSKLFNSGDKIVVQISNTYGKVYVHEMSAKQTVYTLAKTFDQRMNDVQSVNPGINFNSMKVGQKIRVPFLAASIVKNPTDLRAGGKYAEVYYKVRPKDNLYRISKVYFDTTIENLMAINNTRTFDLKADQLLKVGYMPINGTVMSTPSNLATTSTTTSPVKRQATPQASKPAVATTVVPNNSPTARPTAKRTKTAKKTSQAKARRSKPKKKGFFARVFGSKNKKKQRAEKPTKEIVQLTDQPIEKPATKVTQAPVVSAPIQATPEIKAAPVKQPVTNSAVVLPKEDMDIQEEAPEAPVYKYKSEKGIAIWNQTSSNSKNMFVLHPTATVGSYVEITNPMMNKTVQAKVIGNIPPRTYTDDVSIVVSPRVASMLGVVDRRFAVQVKYREE